MIIKDLSQRKTEAFDLLYQVFLVFYPQCSREWFESEVKDVNLNISLGFEENGKLVAIYLLKEDSHQYFDKNLKGIRGDALAILPEARGQRIFEQFLSFIKDNYEFDYLWGTQGKELNNLSFWLKYRFLISEDSQHYFTGQFLK